MALTHAGKVFVVCVVVFGVAAYWLASRMVRRQTGGKGGAGGAVLGVPAAQPVGPGLLVPPAAAPVDPARVRWHDQHVLRTGRR